LHHKICHVLGGAFGLPHAPTHAVVLPYVLAFNAPYAPEAAGRIAAALGDADPTVGLDRLRAELHAPRALRDLGLGPDDVDTAAMLVLPEVPPGNPRPVDADSLAALLHAAWSGRDPRTAGTEDYE
jgi:alcohol dehydrogenase class IV